METSLPNPMDARVELSNIPKGIRGHQEISVLFLALLKMIISYDFYFPNGTSYTLWQTVT
jgi:hypothetical protein